MSECSTCTYNGKHLELSFEQMPWPCSECSGGELYVERGKRKRKTPLRIKIEIVETKIRTLEKALEYYADIDNYANIRIGSAVSQDKGKIARAALNQSKVKK